MKKIKALKPKKAGSVGKIIKVPVTKPGILHKSLQGHVEGENLTIEDTSGASVSGENLDLGE